MDPANAGEHAPAGGRLPAEVEAIEFVRFCHRRRRVGWPELYDEMCAVAGRGLYRGYGQDDLAAIGIGFGLFQMPALAGLVARVVEEDHERRRRSAAALHASVAADSSPDASRRHDASESTEVVAPAIGSIRIAVPAGA